MEERRCYDCKKLLFKETPGAINIEDGVHASRDSNSLGIYIKCPRCGWLNTIFYTRVTEEGIIKY